MSENSSKTLPQTKPLPLIDPNSISTLQRMMSVPQFATLAREIFAALLLEQQRQFQPGELLVGEL